MQRYQLPHITTTSTYHDETTTMSTMFLHHRRLQLQNFAHVFGDDYQLWQHLWPHLRHTFCNIITDSCCARELAGHDATVQFLAHLCLPPRLSTTFLVAGHVFPPTKSMCHAAVAHGASSKDTPVASPSSPVASGADPRSPSPAHGPVPHVVACQVWG